MNLADLFDNNSLSASAYPIRLLFTTEIPPLPPSSIFPNKKSPFRDPTETNWNLFRLNWWIYLGIYFSLNKKAALSCFNLKWRRQAGIEPTDIGVVLVILFSFLVLLKSPLRKGAFHFLTISKIEFIEKKLPLIKIRG